MSQETAAAAEPATEAPAAEAAPTEEAKPVSFHLGAFQRVRTLIDCV